LLEDAALSGGQTMKLFSMTLPEPMAKGLAQCRPHFMLAAGFSALINVLYLAPTIYMMQVYDRVVPTGGIVTLFWITVIVGLAIATLSALEAQRSKLLQRASLRLNRLVASDLLDRLLSRKDAKQGAASNAQVMREFDIVRQLMGGPAAAAFMDLPWTPLYLFVAYLIHPVLAMLVIVGAAILVVLAVSNERRGKAKANEAHSANAAAYAFQEATASKSEAVRALGMRRGLIALQLEKRRGGLEATQAYQFSSGRHNALVKFVRMFLQSFALGAGAYLAVSGEISVGSIIGASVLLSRALQPIEQLVGHWQMILQARGAVKLLDDIYDNSDNHDRVRTALPAPTGRLELDRIVVKSDDGAALILKNVSLSLKPGEMIGVVGPSGAGKSTLARVAALALTPDFGDIRIDSANVADWDGDQLATHIGYLPQKIDLLPGSVSENISRFGLARGLARADVDRDVVAAAQMAGIHEMVLQLPSGYDTRIESGSFALSAGQSQRVALARALYGDPKILILDEPNAALDSDGEQALALAMNAARKRGAGVIIVAHRAAILGNADTLIVMKDGGVVHSGPRAEVLEQLAPKTAVPNVVPIHEGAR
jgi:PrtD family type I secretion system ABC transporter